MKLALNIGLVTALLLVGCGGGIGQDRTAQTEPGATNPAPAASTLPPAPTLATLRAPDTLDRSSSIAGPDANRDGIRDDINRWIDTQPYSQPEKQAVAQLAVTLQQSLLVNAKNKEEARRVMEAISKAMDCVRSTYGPESPKPPQIASHLEAITANTKERAMQYIQFNSALHGMTLNVPSIPTCN